MDAAYFLPPAVLAASALSVLAALLAVVFQLRRERLPAATRFADLDERNTILGRKIDEKTHEFNDLLVKIQQRDHLSAEVAALEQRRDLVRAEWDQLADSRSEIESVKTEAAQAAGDHALRLQELQDTERELEARKRDLGKLLDPGLVEQIKSEVEQLEQRRLALQQEIDELRAERDAARTIVAEARALEIQLAVLKAEIEQRQSDLATENEKRETLRALDARIEIARAEAEQIEKTLARRTDLEADVARLSAQFAALEGQIEQLDGSKADLHDIEGRLARRRTEEQELVEAIGRLQARKAKLETEAGSTTEEDQEGQLADLTQFPDFLRSPAVLRRAPQTESEALADVDADLARHGLSYGRRAVRAFHTALKINDNAQLTVLAGVSGTGKSLLPRRYAEALGIHFLQIAVEPRWDSPQDLLGFYNYIEKKYRATDLARLLVQMDPYSSFRQHEGDLDRSDRMAIVLLDEMNLARVEYYFSEFLSRLEVRPPSDAASDADKRRGAQIAVDIRGLERPVSLFPSHNVLFVGTMNDDESTQALSEKVLDRGNVIQFAAPDFSTTDRRAEGAASPLPAQSSRPALTFKQWQGWCKKTDRLAESGHKKAEKVIQNLANIMEDCERPFGHRLRDSILAYVANYPQDGHGPVAVEIPLADQIDFRIMPKLRGVSLDAHRAPLDRLETLIREDLGDHSFAEEFHKLRDRQASGTGLFSWRGLIRKAD